MVNESLHPARLNSTMKRTRHPAEQIIRKLKTAEQLIAYRLGQDFRRRLPLDRVVLAELPLLETAVRGNAGRGGQRAHSAAEGERPAQKASGRGRAEEGSAQGSWS